MAEGLFGSNVGASRSSRPRMLPGIAAEKLATGAPKALPKAPHFTVPHSTKAPVSLTGLSTHRSTTGFSVSKPVSYGVSVTAAKSSGGGILGAVEGVAPGVEGFIGNLGSDAVHMALGFPAGIAFMVQHPVTAGESMVKATWADWSPLFHGNVDLFAHNFYAHPLAPILDAVSVLTLGAGSAARGAALVSKLGDAAEVTDTADVAAQAAHAASQVGKSPMQRAFAASRVTPAQDRLLATERGARGLEPVTTAQKLARFANPTKYGQESYLRIAQGLGFKGARADQFVEDAMAADGKLSRLRVTKAGDLKINRLNKNPLLRARDDLVHSMANKLADTQVAQTLKISHIVGDQAVLRRWGTLDAGARSAAVTSLVRHQINALHEAGHLLETMSAADAVEHMTGPMQEGMHALGRPVMAAGYDLATSTKDTVAMAAQAKDIAAENRLYVVDPMVSGPKLKAEWDKIAGVTKKYGKGSTEETKAVQDFLKGSEGAPSGFAKAMTSDNPADAIVDSRGNLRLASSRHEAADALGNEAFNSNAAVRLLWNNPTKAWRYLLLGISPRYFVNNFVGNGIMAMAATDPVTLFRALVDRYRMGKLAERQIAARVDAAMASGDTRLASIIRSEPLLRGKTFLDKYYSQEHSGFAMSNFDRDAEGQGWINKANRKFSLHGFTHRKADLPYRESMIIATLRRTPEFQRAYAEFRGAGDSSLAATMKAGERASQSEAVRQLVREQVRHTMGQYHTFTEVEKMGRQLMPFYAWSRHITRHMQTLITQEPYKVAMGAAIGSLGEIKTQQIMGNVPDFLGSAIPAKLLSGPLSPIKMLLGMDDGTKNGRMSILNALSMSPYGSVADLLKTGAALSPGGAGMKGVSLGDSFGGQLNPLIQGFAQQLAGVDLMTGAPVKPAAGGPIIGLYTSAFGNVPQAGLLKGLLGAEPSNTTKTGNPTMYEHNFQAALTSYLGMPERNVSLQATQAEYAKEYGIKKPKGQLKSIQHVTGMPGL